MAFVQAAISGMAALCWFAVGALVREVFDAEMVRHDQRGTGRGAG